MSVLFRYIYDKVSCIPQHIDDEIYKCDIYKLKEKMKESVCAVYNIIAECDDEKPVDLFTIYYKVFPKPCFMIEKNDSGKMVMNIKKSNGNAALYVNIRDSITSEIIIKDRQIHLGENILEELDENGVYDILPYMIEDDGLFDTKRTDYKVIKATGYFERSNISGRIFKLECVQYNRKSLSLSKRYYLIVNEKMHDNVYKGTLITADKTDKARIFSSQMSVLIRRFKGKNIRTSISMTVSGNNRRYELLYDKRSHIEC